MGDIIIPGREHTMRMSIAAFKKIAAYVLEHGDQFKQGDYFTIEGTDKKKLVILLEK